MADSQERRMIVMMSPGTVDRNDNPFVPMLIDSLKDCVQVKPFSWRSAFVSRYQVLHIHWPERMTKDPSRLRATMKSMMFLALLGWNRFRHVSNVATVHNIEPHEGSGQLQRWVLRLWDRACVARIFLSRSGLAADTLGTGVYIPHGDYVPFVESHVVAILEQETNSVLTFGYLRPYKGIEKLVEAFSHSEQVRLTVAGEPLSEDYRKQLIEFTRAAKADSVQLIPHSLSPDELIGAISRAEVVILPYVRIYNSGAALLALSVGRPLIVTDSPSMQELKHEVGDQWLEVLPVAWTMNDIINSIDALRNRARLRAHRPCMESRLWDSVGVAHVSLYRSLDRRRPARAVVSSGTVNTK